MRWGPENGEQRREDEEWRMENGEWTATVEWSDYVQLRIFESTTEEPSRLDEQLRITSQEDVDGDVTIFHV